ncbi:MAG: type II secretion system protein [Phycisphaerales bacterium]
MKRRAVTLIELLGVIAIIALLIGILLPALGKARQSARQLKDSTQVRGIHQALVLWAQNNQDDYPLPSRIDKQNYTIPVVPVGSESFKDTTGNIFSMMIFTGSLSTEIFINPAEANGLVTLRDTYEFDSPQGAATPAQALWDPKFRGTPLDAPGAGSSTMVGTAGTPGHSSYAHNPPFGKRRARWTNSFTATEAVVGNRGPVYTLTATPTRSWNPVTGNQFGDQSVTLLIHGSRVRWEGNIAFNDNHAEFLSKADPENVTFSFTGMAAGMRTQPDNIFVNENDNTGNAQGGETASASSNTGTYNDANVHLNANAYLRPYAQVTGNNTTPTIKVWVD